MCFAFHGSNYSTTVESNRTQKVCRRGLLRTCCLLIRSLFRLECWHSIWWPSVITAFLLRSRSTSVASIIIRNLRNNGTNVKQRWRTMNSISRWSWSFDTSGKNGQRSFDNRSRRNRSEKRGDWCSSFLKDSHEYLVAHCTSELLVSGDRWFRLAVGSRTDVPNPLTRANHSRFSSDVHQRDKSKSTRFEQSDLIFFQ